MNTKERADRAKALLTDDVFNMALSEIEAGYLRKLKDTDPADTERVRMWVLALNIMEQLPGKLRQFVDAGEVQEFELRQQRFMDSIRERITP